MRWDGILQRWDDARGFGFIAPTRGGAEVFVHISAFGERAAKPTPGETVSFELGRGKDGRPQAVNVVKGTRRTACGVAASPSPAGAPRAWRLVVSAGRTIEPCRGCQRVGRGCLLGL